MVHVIPHMESIASASHTSTEKSLAQLTRSKHAAGKINGVALPDARLLYPESAAE